MTVLAAHNWASNADLMADVHTLYPLDEVRDVTHGRGLWWAKHRPRILVGSDIRGYPDGVGPLGAICADPPVDFLNLPDDDDTWPVVAFDPPYLPQTAAQQSSSKLARPEGSDTSDFGDRYGLHTGHASNWIELRALVAGGIKECTRICAPKGIVLVKCMNYVVGGKHRPQVAWAIADGETAGLEVAAQFVHIKGTGPQPTLKADGTPRAVRSPRANYSTLIVFRKATQ
jgi:hypothetical protein